MYYDRKTLRFEVRCSGLKPFFTDVRSEAHKRARLTSLCVNRNVYVNDLDTDQTHVWFRGNRFDLKR